MLPGMNRYLPAALLAAACLLTACAPATPVATVTVTANPSVGITTHSVVISSAPATASSGLAAVTAVSDWWTGGGQARTNAISAALAKMTSDSSDPNAVGADCTNLSTAISAAQTYKPIPDAQAQQHWSAALDKYQQAATDCSAGVAATDAGLITKAGTEINAGTAELQQATARVNAITTSG